MLARAGKNVVVVFGQGWLSYQMSTLSPYHKKINPLNERLAILTYKLRSCSTVQEAIKFTEQNTEQIQAIGKSMLLDYFNEMYMDPRVKTGTQFIYINNLLANLKDLKIYEKTLRLSILQKTKLFYMYSNDFVIHDKLVEDAVQSLIDQLQKQKQFLSINDYFNVLIIFRVQIHQNLVQKCFEPINQLILHADQTVQYTKMWKILIHQFSYYNWNQLRKYPNIIKFFTENYDWVKTTPLRQATQFFLEITKMKLHLVGQRKVPKCVNQIAPFLLQKIDEIPIKNVCMILKVYNSLPKQFHLDLKKALIKKIQVTKITNHAEVRFPFQVLSEEVIDKFFSNDQNFPSLWYCLLYCDNLQRYQKFLRGSVVTSLKKYLNQSASKIIIQKSTQVFSRICSLIYYFSKVKDDQTLRNIKIILENHIDEVGMSALNDIHLNSFLNLLVLFEKDPRQQQIQRVFLEVIEKKKMKLALYESNFVDLCFVALEFHLNTLVPIVRQNIIRLSNSIMSKEKQVTHDELKLLILLIRHQIDESNIFVGQLKERIWGKIPNEQIQVVLQYYSLSGYYCLKSFQQIFLQLQSRKVSFPIILKFLSTVSLDQIENKRGRLEQNLVNYLNQTKQSLGSAIKSNGLNYLNDVTRVLGILSNFAKTDEFNQRLYIATLNAISQSIWEDVQGSGKPFSLNGRSSRAIINFIMKFQDIFTIQNFSHNGRVLWKIYKIYTTLLEQDDGPYIKAKFLEFSLIYKPFIDIPEGIEIQPLYSVNMVLESAYNLPQFTDIMFVLLKLHCLGLEKLDNKKILQYSSLIQAQIDEEKLSVFNVSNKVATTNFHIKLLKLPSHDSKYFKQVLSPLYLKSIQAQRYVNMKMIQPFLHYFFFTNQIQELRQPMIKLLQQKIAPMDIANIIKLYPIGSFDMQLFRILANKAAHVSHLLDSSGVHILYFFERAFYQAPSQFSSVLEDYWEKVTKILGQKIQIIKSSNYSYEKASYLLGSYGLYMFCCIKRNRTVNNNVFKYLSQFVLANGDVFLNIAKRNELLIRINRKIYLYVSANAQVLSRNRYRIKQNPSRLSQQHSMQYSEELQRKLREQDIKFYKFYEVEGIRVPYFCADQSEIIVVANQYNRNFAYDKHGQQNQAAIEVTHPAHGLFRFEIEVYRKLLSKYKVKVYNEFTGKYVDE